MKHLGAEAQGAQIATSSHVWGTFQENYSELPCDKDAPPCGATCEKLLPCRQHYCTERCHAGPCAICRALIVKSCACGRTKKEVPCCEQLRCVPTYLALGVLLYCSERFR